MRHIRKVEPSKNMTWARQRSYRQSSEPPGLRSKEVTKCFTSLLVGDRICLSEVGDDLLLGDSDVTGDGSLMLGRARLIFFSLGSAFTGEVGAPSSTGLEGLFNSEFSFFFSGNLEDEINKPSLYSLINSLLTLSQTSPGFYVSTVQVF